MGKARAYVVFGRPHASKSGKTRIWPVLTTDGLRLGEIRWYSPWRCYALFPETSTIFEHRCLRDISDFCESMTRTQRAKRNKT